MKVKQFKEQRAKEGGNQSYYSYLYERNKKKPVKPQSKKTDPTKKPEDVRKLKAKAKARRAIKGF